MMLADGCESAVRSSLPASAEQIDEIVRKIIRGRLADGQLDECDLTLRDLEQVRETFQIMLESVFHPRIQYPEAAQQRALPAPEAQREAGQAVSSRPSEEVSA